MKTYFTTNIPDIGTLPCAFRNILQQDIIPGTVRQKATLSNRKFRFKAVRVYTSGKPISKITG